MKTSMDRTRVLAGAALVSLAIAAAGCSGGGSSPLPKPTTAPNAPVQFAITVPVASSSSAVKKPEFEAPSGAQSVSIQLTSVNGTSSSSAPVVENLTSSNKDCSTANGTMTCTTTVQGAPGSDVFTVTSYSQTDAKGTALGTGTTQVNAVQGQTTTAPVTLSGTVAAIALSVQGIGVPGQSNTLSVLVLAKDANGATIMGTYSNPITLADSDTSGATTLSKTTLNDSTAAAGVTLTYTGAAISSATISATASGVASSKITSATFTPNTDYAPSNGTVMTYNMSLAATQTWGTGTPQPEQTATATQTDTYSTGATFQGQTNLMKVNELLTVPDQQQSLKRVRDIGFIFFGGNQQNYYYKYNFNTTGATVNQVGWEYVTDPNNNPGNEQDYTVASGSGWQIAQLPFHAGNTWNAGSGYTETSTYDTTVYNGNNDVPATGKDIYVWNADGTYTDTYDLSAKDGSFTSSHEVWQAKADGSTSDVYTDRDGTDTITYGTPEPAPSGTPGNVIRITETWVDASPSPGASPAPTSTPDVTLAPVWYPNGTVPSPLQSDQSTDKGSVAIPQQCNIPSSMATTAEQIEEVYSDFDPFGYVDSFKADYYYASGIGLVCAVEHDNWQNYDVYHDSLNDAFTIDSVKALTAQQLQSTLTRATSMANAAQMASQGLQAAVSHHRTQSRKQILQARTNRHRQLLHAHGRL